MPKPTPGPRLLARTVDGGCSAVLPRGARSTILGDTRAALFLIRMVPAIEAQQVDFPGAPAGGRRFHLPDVAAGLFQGRGQGGSIGSFKYFAQKVPSPAQAVLGPL